MCAAPQTLTISRPDDAHLHLRDGEMLRTVLPHTARCFARAMVMPNLPVPITTTDLALAYRERILAVLPADMAFTPLMTLYLTDNTLPSEIASAQASGGVIGVKLYPAGATTHSAKGVTDLKHCYPVLAMMERLGMPLLVHGEVVDAHVDMFDREAVFIERILQPLLKDFPQLKVVLEHITTQSAVEFVQSSPAHIVATVTAHHLLLNRNALFAGGIRPHHYCLPVLKRERHRLALLQAVTQNNPKFFLGTDSAPHLQSDKESACGCAGMYTAYHAMALYATAFESVGALDKLAGFASEYAADFYGLAHNTETITLCRQVETIPTEFKLTPTQSLIPLWAGEPLAWRLLADGEEA